MDRIMDRVTVSRVLRALLLPLVAGLGFLAGSIAHPGAAASGLATAKPCAKAAPTASPTSSKVGVGNYHGWTVTVTRFTTHKPGEYEQLPAGNTIYVLHVIIENRGTRTWMFFSNQFRLEDEHHQVYDQEPLSIFPDVHALSSEILTPGTKIERDVLKIAPAHAHFRLRVLLAQVDGSPDMVITLPPLQPA